MRSHRNHEMTKRNMTLSMDTKLVQICTILTVTGEPTDACFYIMTVLYQSLLKKPSPIEVINHVINFNTRKVLAHSSPRLM